MGTNIYGTNASDAVSYASSLLTAAANFEKGDVITPNSVKALVDVVNQERQRRMSTYSALSTTFSGTIKLSDITTIINGIEVATKTPNPASYQNGSNTTVAFPVAPAYTQGIQASSLASSSVVYSQTMQDIAAKVLAAGQVCVCNCNYCTCNCNYCTCNCNYNCTCNCNYSDERLKENVEHVGTVEGLNVYVYTYVWDKTKKYRGVMAQELVGTQYEKALFTDSNGYYTVDYSQLPVEFEEL